MRSTLIRKIQHHQRWRRGADIPMMHPKEIGQALDDCIKVLEALDDEQFNKAYYGKKNDKKG